MPKTNMKYEVVIKETTHLRFNVKGGDLYKKCGGNIIGCLVEKHDDDGEHILDAVLCFSTKDINKFLEKYDNKLKHTSEYFYLDWRDKKSLLKKYNGITLLVEEIAVIDFDGTWDDEPDYNTKNDLFNPEYYDPDDWEFILKVRKVL